MTNSTHRMPLSPGEVVSLMPLGEDIRATVISRSWSPALGEVVRLHDEGHSQTCHVIVLYGEQLERLVS